MARAFIQFALFAILSVSACFNLQAQSLNPKHTKLDSYLSTLNENNRMMTAVYVSKHGKPQYEFYSGLASIDGNVPLSEKTRFRVGSITKIFTSVLIMQLVDRGKLALDTRLDTFYPDIPNASSITIEMLLNHRTGIPNLTDQPAYMEYMTESQSREQMEQRILSYESIFKPGSKHQYSNSNYLLLGYIIESIYQKPYAEVAAEKIIRPLGLTSTYYGKSIKIANHEALSYRFTDKWDVQPETHMSIPHGAGAMVSTAREINAFLTALFEGKLVTEESLNAMMTLRDGYGLGMFIAPFYDKKFYGHNGGIDGFVSAVGYNPADGVTIAVLSNGVNYNFNDVMIAVLSSVYDR